jgi:hypothetical protein
MITPKKILLPLFLIIVLITFSILLKIVIAGYKPPFGGEYTNLCGTGHDATIMMIYLGSAKHSVI